MVSQNIPCSSITNNSLVIIPIRKGSKRFPGKHFAQLAGKTLIDFTINYALQTFQKKQVVISSDDPQVAAYCKNRGLRFLERPKKLALDETSTAHVLQYHISQMHEAGIKYQWVVLLQTTQPFRPQNLWHRAEALLNKNTQAESLLSVSPIHKKQGTIEENIFYPANYVFGQRSQTLSPSFFENGLLYITRWEQVLKGNIQTTKPLALVIDTAHATVDIDTPQDLLWAEFLLQKGIVESKTIGL